MKRLVNFVIQLGTSDNNTLEFNNTLRLLNILTFSCVLFIMPFIISMFLLDEWLIAFIFVGTLIMFSASLWLCHIGKYRLSKFLIFTSTNYVVLFLSISTGHDAGFYLYYMTSPLILFSVFEHSETKKIIAYVLFHFSSYVIVEYLYSIEYPVMIVLEDSILRSLYLLNAFLSILFLFILAFNYSKFHQKVSQMDAASNKKLSVSQLKLEALIIEKNVLLAELHHRVKNNMAVLSGLFNLQISQTENAEAIDILKKNKARVMSMSLIHNSLYLQNNTSKISFNKYLRALCEEVSNSFGSESTIVNFSYDIKDVLLDLSKAVPCGIITNEIIVNAFKHAFIDRKHGEINVKFYTNSENYVLEISDNGLGLKEGDRQKKNSLGMSLINALTEQLDGEIYIGNNNGTSYKLSFPSKHL